MKQLNRLFPPEILIIIYRELFMVVMFSVTIGSIVVVVLCRVQTRTRATC